MRPLVLWSFGQADCDPGGKGQALDESSGPYLVSHGGQIAEELLVRTSGPSEGAEEGLESRPWVGCDGDRYGRCCGCYR